MAFPVIAMVVPLVLSVVMALVLHSPLALMMGVLGPVMVFAGWWQTKRTQSRGAARLADEFSTAQQQFQKEIDTAREAERASARSALPQVLQAMGDPLWRRAAHPSVLVRVGEGVWSPPAHHPLEGTGVILGMPAGIDASAGLALIGNAEALGVWRNLVVQWLLASGPDGLDPAPSLTRDSSEREFAGVSRLVWVTDIASVPSDCGLVVVFHGDSMVTITEVGQPSRQVRPDTLSFAEVLWALEKLSSAQVPTPEVHDPLGQRGRLRAQLSPVSPVIDLVREGPHTVVWGATGSGKSVTVCELVVSLASRYPPSELVCVLVDFKGGAGLRPLLALPHTVGMVSDLDPARSDRALAGLVAEMEKRERIMAKHKVSDVAQLGDSIWCPRLLVVVDEVAWLCQTSPKWADTLSDVAQRGRSLGVHLILATQRITGVLPRALMANVSLRLCGRISEEAEVVEWMPDASASLTRALRHVPPGRVLLAGALSTPVWHSVAPGESIPQRITALGETPASQWRVWCEELPSLVPPVAGTWALRDQPESQAQEQLRDNPLEQGSVVVVGDSGSGRTCTGFALASLSPRSFLAPAHPAELWQCVRDLHAQSAVIVVDDADALLHGAGVEAEAFMLDALEAFDGALVMTISPRHRLARGLARLAPGLVALSLASTEDQHTWGAHLQPVPGRARFAGHEIQVTFPSPAPTLWAPTELVATGRPLIVLTETPEDWVEVQSAFVGTADEALGQWQRLSPQLGTTDVVLDQVGHRDVRHATLGRITPPPMAPPPGWCWVWRNGAPYLASAAGLRRW